MIFLDIGNRNSILLIGLMVFLVLCSYSCEEGERVERGQVYVPSLDNVIASEIIHDDCGVTAGDGMYSILLPDGRSIFLMGDSYTGKVTNNARSTSDHMFRNTYHIYDHGKVSAVTSGGNHSAAVPVDYPEEEKWYWPGHGFVKDDVLYIFQFLMYQGADGAWGFRFENTHLLEYRLPDLTLIWDSKIPYSGPSSVMCHRHTPSSKIDLSSKIFS